MNPLPGRWSVAVDGGKLSVVVVPGLLGADGVPVLFVHGINGGAVEWCDVMERLHTGRLCVAPDLRGHGQSDPVGPFTAKQYAADLVAVLDALDVPRAHVVGTSFGGIVSVVLAASAPERVASLALLGSTLAPQRPTAKLDDLPTMAEAGVRGFFEAAVPRVSFAPDSDPARIAEAVEVAAAGRSPELVAEVAGAAFATDVRDVATEVRCPTLVATGELDLTCPLRQGQELAATLGTELVVLPGRGHMAMMEDPAGTAALLAAFVARVTDDEAD